MHESIEKNIETPPPVNSTKLNIEDASEDTSEIPKISESQQNYQDTKEPKKMNNSETITEKENEEIRKKDSHLNLQFPKL